jgi:hypothetical protein
MLKPAIPIAGSIGNGHIIPMRPVIRKVDSNHAEIIEAFRKLGWSARSTATIGKGFPDAVVGKFGYTTLIEIKDGAKPQSKRRLTEDEEEFFKEWRGSLVLIESIQDVISFDRKQAFRKM